MALPTASDNVFPKLILSEGAAPATPAAGTVIQYAKADGLLYSKDDAGTETLVSGGAGGGGGGSAWTQNIDEDGTSFANFTPIDGTWASNGTLIQQTATSTLHDRCRYTALIPFGSPFIAEFEARIDTEHDPETGHAAGMVIGFDGTTGTSAGFAFSILSQNDIVQTERFGVAQAESFAATINTATFYKLRAVVGGPWASIYLDGTLMGTAYMGALASADPFYIGLFTYAASASFRNIKFWTLSQPA